MSWKKDREALELAMAKAMESRAEQIDWKLRREPWREVAEFASFACQCESLNLKPWELPPCSDGAAEDMDTDTGRLLQRMLAAGISKYHSDPLAALREREGRPSI